MLRATHGMNSPAPDRGLPLALLLIRRYVFPLALLAAIATWFFPYRAPLWLDETISYWEIEGGWRQIWPRTVEGLSFPAYFYILSLFRNLFGSRELILRIPSVLAMLAAVYVLYFIAREFFEPDLAYLVCILFSLQRNVAFAAIDVRPYAFAVLATNLAIYALVTWTRDPSTRGSVLLGVSSAFVLYFHYLYAAILPAFVGSYFVLRRKSLPRDLRQIVIVLVSFVVAVSPVIPRLLDLISHRFMMSGARATPSVLDLGAAFFPTAAPLTFLTLWVIGVVIVDYRSGSLPVPTSKERICFGVASLLFFVPIVIFYAISTFTRLGVFVERYKLVAAAGFALFWTLAISRIYSKSLRLAFCILFVPCAVYAYWHSPEAHRHSYSWKPALEYAQLNAEHDQSPLLICSDIPQANFLPMPEGHASESIMFAPLSYYKVTVPVVPLPRALTPAAKEIGSRILISSSQKQQRFLVLAFPPSLPTVQWLIDQSANTFRSRTLGTFDGVSVVEFVPRK